MDKDEVLETLVTLQMPGVWNSDGGRATRRSLLRQIREEEEIREFIQKFRDIGYDKLKEKVKHYETSLFGAKFYRFLGVDTPLKYDVMMAVYEDRTQKAANEIHQ